MMSAVRGVLGLFLVSVGLLVLGMGEVSGAGLSEAKCYCGEGGEPNCVKTPCPCGTSTCINWHPTCAEGFSCECTSPGANQCNPTEEGCCLKFSFDWGNDAACPVNEGGSCSTTCPDICYNVETYLVRSGAGSGTCSNGACMGGGGCFTEDSEQCRLSTSCYQRWCGGTEDITCHKLESGWLWKGTGSVGSELDGGANACSDFADNDCDGDEDCDDSDCDGNPACLGPVCGDLPVSQERTVLMILQAVLTQCVMNLPVQMGVEKHPS